FSMPTSFIFSFFFYSSGVHRDLHSFPTRRSSDLGVNAPLDDAHLIHVLDCSLFTSCDNQPLSACKKRNLGFGRRLVVGIRQCRLDRKSTRLNSSHLVISYAVFCLKKKNKTHNYNIPRLSPGKACCASFLTQTSYSRHCSCITASARQS